MREKVLTQVNPSIIIRNLRNQDVINRIADHIANIKDVIVASIDIHTDIALILLIGTPPLFH